MGEDLSHAADARLEGLVRAKLLVENVFDKKTWATSATREAPGAARSRGFQNVGLGQRLLRYGVPTFPRWCRRDKSLGWPIVTPRFRPPRQRTCLTHTQARIRPKSQAFYRWYDRFLAFGDAGLEDRNSSPGRVWNRIPDDVRGQIIDLALEETQLSPRELAVRFTDTRGYFVSEASVYRLLKAHDLITSPAFVVIKAADEFRDKTTAPNQLWQTDFTYLRSRSSAGAGFTCRPSWTTIPATSLLGSSAPT